MADVTISITIPDAYVNKVISMLELVSDKPIITRVGSQRLRLVNAFFFSSKAGGESQTAHFKRLLKELILSFLRILELDISHKNIAIAEAQIDRSVAEVNEESVA